MQAPLLEIFIKGLLLGVAIAAPIGTIGVLCLRRLITRGGIHCLVSGLGAATADAIFAILAAFGMALVADTLSGLHLWVRIASGLLVGGIGVRIFVSRPTLAPPNGETEGLVRSFFTIFLITISNPANILAIAAIMGALGVMSTAGGHSPWLVGAMLALGVFLGSASWWVVLGLLHTLFDIELGEKQLVWVNRIGGVCLMGLGVLLLLGWGVQTLEPVPLVE